MNISIIIPCLNESIHIRETLQCLQAMRRRGHEIIVVDGGSLDNTLDIANPLCDELIQCNPGRALQMNTGAGIARNELLWFLHADTQLPSDMDFYLLKTLQQSQKVWGRFNIRLSGRQPSLRLVENLINIRSRLSGIATGDQGIFVKTAPFKQAGGFADIPLMEDIELSKRLKKCHGRPLCLPQKLLTSSRRWETRGVVRTILLMWKLRLYYALGADPSLLARQYQ